MTSVRAQSAAVSSKTFIEELSQISNQLLAEQLSERTWQLRNALLIVAVLSLLIQFGIADPSNPEAAGVKVTFRDPVSLKYTLGWLSLAMLVSYFVAFGRDWLYTRYCGLPAHADLVTLRSDTEKKLSAVTIELAKIGNRLNESLLAILDHAVTTSKAVLRDQSIAWEYNKRVFELSRKCLDQLNEGQHDEAMASSVEIKSIAEERDRVLSDHGTPDGSDAHQELPTSEQVNELQSKVQVLLDDCRTYKNQLRQMRVLSGWCKSFSGANNVLNIMIPLIAGVFAVGFAHPWSPVGAYLSNITFVAWAWAIGLSCLAGAAALRTVRRRQWHSALQRAFRSEAAPR